ncbi:MAG: hypothetical protein KAJ23_16745 [Maribacter sp.]|nr:hypothetical protein [Maribacter sp.]
MDFIQMNIWCLIIPLLVGVICAYLGYLIGKKNKKVSIDEAEWILIQEKNRILKANLEACNDKLSAASALAAGTATTAVASLTTTTNTEKYFDSAAAKAAMGKPIKQDDLKIVEGIGPKIAGMFHDSGISTWKALSEVAVAKCHEVLDKAGNRYKMHDPASWPMQAKMAYEGKWEELAKWQHKHKHGKL